MSPSFPRLAAAVLVTLPLAACTDAAPDATPEPTVAQPAPASTSAVPAPSGSTVAAAELCDFLRKKLADWKSADGENAAQAQVAVDLFTFYQEQGAVPVGREIDEQARTQCPAVRFDVLQTAGIKDFMIL